MAEDGSFFSNIYDKYAKEYVAWFLLMLSDPKGIVEKTRQIQKEGRQSEYLLIVLAVSVFLGATLGALIPNRPHLNDRITIFVVVSCLWIFLSFFVHFFCRILGGKENMNISLSLMAQNLAFVYVVSNFITLLVTELRVLYEPFDTFLKSRLLYDTPGTIIFTVQFLLLLFLVPVTISRAHGFTGYTWYVVAMFAASFSIFFGIPVFALGGC